MTGPLGRTHEGLARASIGAVPITWNNADLPDLAPPITRDVVLDETRRLGYEGTQAQQTVDAATLAPLLQARGLRLAEAYVALPCSAAGLSDDALEVGRGRLQALDDADGEVLVVALDLSPERDVHGGRAAEPSTPALTDAAMSELARTVETLAAEAHALGRRVAFHAHTGTYVETPHELDRLIKALDAIAAPDASRVGICLDVGHYTVGGGDPVAALRRYGERVTHVHLKDVDAQVLADLREGPLGSFRDAIRARIFTELGSGVLDLPGILGTLADRGYDGWLMVEQDTSWSPPSEALAIGRRVLAYAIRTLPAAAQAAA